MRVDVKVTTVSFDPATLMARKEQERSDLSFSLQTDGVRDVKAAAKNEFARLHGEDLKIYSVNFARRGVVSLYVCEHQNHPKAILARRIEAERAKDAAKLLRPMERRSAASRVRSAVQTAAPAASSMGKPKVTVRL